ncbi:MAG: AzlC family ABC transporter permease [Clostridia bacterium]|nr:AzlC family ABC transporter permease [Clostridia bacterium]
MKQPRSLQPYAAALRAAFPHTIPILTGFLFLGTTFGIYMRTSGLGTPLALLMSIFVFAGSMQFVAVELLLALFRPFDALLLTLMMGARHLFYGIAMLPHYRGMGLKKAYLIFGMCDESFSINCTALPPDGVDHGLFMFFVTLLNQLYWIVGTLIGCFFGSLITFNTEGLDFVMTAMFAVILLEQLQKKQNRPSALLGLGLSLLCLLIFGADAFMIPAMLAILGALILLRPLLEGGAPS